MKVPEGRGKKKQKERLKRAEVTAEGWKLIEEGKILRKPHRLQMCVQVCRDMVW